MHWKRPRSESSTPRAKKVGQALKVIFNPKELTFSKSNTWNATKTPKDDTPEIDFGGGHGMSLKLQLYFDTYAEKASETVSALPTRSTA